MTRPILVPLDGSELALAALPLAVAIARASSASLALVRVHLALVDGDPMALAPVDAEIRAYEERYIARIAADVAQDTGLTVEREITDDPVALAIAERAATLDAEMIVMTTHGYTGLTRLWLGSVASGVLRQATMPLLLVRPRDHDASEEGGAGTAAAQPRPVWLTPAPLPRHILLPLDGSERAEAIVRHAVALGRLGGARYTLLRVVNPVRVPLHPYPFLAPAFDVDAAEQEQAVEHARGHLEGIAERIRALAPNASVQVDVCVDDRVASAILDYADAITADVIALTARGHGPGRLVVGSIADKVLRGAKVPLLMVRPEEPGR